MPREGVRLFIDANFEKAMLFVLTGRAISLEIQAGLCILLFRPVTGLVAQMCRYDAKSRRAVETMKAR